MTRGHLNQFSQLSLTPFLLYLFPLHLFLATLSSPSYLAERSTLGNNDMELPLSGCLFKEGFYCSRIANGHDHLIGVDVLQSLGCNVLRCAFCKNSFARECETAMLHPRQAWQWFRKKNPSFLDTAHLEDWVSPG